MRRFLLAIVALSPLALAGSPAHAQTVFVDGGYGAYVFGWRGPQCCAWGPAPAAVPLRYMRLVEQMPYCAYCDRPPTRYILNPYWPPACVGLACPVVPVLAAPAPMFAPPPVLLVPAPAPIPVFAAPAPVPMPVFAGPAPVPMVTPGPARMAPPRDCVSRRVSTFDRRGQRIWRTVTRCR